MAQAFRTQNLRLLASILDANDNELIKSPSLVTSAVNELTISNAATTVSPSISATGDDANISLNLISKGTGNILINGKAISLANSFTTAGNFSLSFTTTGNTSLTLPTSGTLATTSQIPTVYDNTLTLAGSGGVSVSATPTFTANASADKTITITIADAALTLGKLADIGGSTILGNSSPSSAGAPAALSVATVASMLSNQTMNIVGTATSVTDIVLVAKGGTGVATANANTIFVGPSSGSAAAPSFRAMVTEDIPTGIVTYAKIQYVANTARVLGRISSLSGEIEELTGANIVTVIDTNAVSRATNLAGGIAGQIPYQSAANTTAFSAAGTASQVLLSGAAGAPTWASQSSLSVGSATTAGSVTNALTISSPLTGTSYNGSAAISIGLPNASDTVVGAVSIGAQTFGGSKTFKDDVIVSGNLTVNGTTITINSSTLSVDDKNIELGAVIAIASLSSTSDITATSNIVNVASTSGLIVGQALTKTTGTGAFGTNPIIASIVSSTQFTVSPVHVTTGSIVFSVSGATDITADTGGITLKGATDKTFNWLNATSSWTSSENLNIVTGKTYKINNVGVLDATTLGSSVVNSSLTSVGTLVNLTVTNAINGSVTGSAASLSTPHTFWGQTFNGTQDVSGNLTSVGNITGSSGLTITAGGSNQNVVLTPSGTGYTLLNGNVGIGTLTPGTKLEVTENLTSAAVLRIKNLSSTGFSGTEYLDPSGNVDLYIGLEQNGGAGRYNSLDGGHRFYVSSTERMRIASDGNVGIGTIAPAAKLHINSTTSGAALLRADGTNGTLFSVVDDLSDSLMSVNNSAGLPVLEVFADDRIVAGQYGQNDLVVINNKVGLGANSPINKLSVIGSASIGDSTYNVSAPTNGLIVQGNVGIGTVSPTNGTLQVYNASGNTLSLQKSGGAAALAIGSETTVYALIESINTGGIKFYTGNGSQTERWKITSAGILESNGAQTIRTSIDSLTLATNGNNGHIVLSPHGIGNVGIGTATPGAKLDVIGGLRVKSAGAAITLDTSTTSDGRMEYKYNGTRKALIGVDSDNLQIAVDSGNYLQFRTNSSERIRITNDGSVGIGITSPATTLDVNGTTFLRGSLDAGRTGSLNTTTAVNGTGGGNREFVTFTGASATGFTGTDNADQGYGYFAATIVSGKSYEVSATMVVTNGATLDWVTSTVLSSPSVPVQSIISSPVSNTIYRFVATANAAFVGLGFSWTSGTMTAVVSNFSIKEVSILVTSNSNVGIVTTSPTDTLDVNGTARIRSISASGSAATIFLSTGATGVLVSRTAAEVRSDIGAGTGNGTVTSVTASTPLEATAGNAPVISLSGIVPIANGGTGIGTTIANAFFVGPNGSTGAPTFRLMASEDIPAGIVTLAKIQNIAVSTVLGNSSSSAAQAPLEISMTTLAAMLNGKTMDIVGNATNVTGTVLVANGGTGVTTATTNTFFAAPNGSTGAPSFRAIVSADIPSSITLTTPVIGNIKMGYTTTATAAGTTTLTASSNHYQRFTGSTTQTITLPVTSTLVAGMSYVIENASTGLLTVNSSGGNLVITVIPGVSVNCLCVGITLTTAADWDVEYDEFASITGTGSVVLSISPALVTPALGIPTSGTLTNCDGTAANLTAGNVTTNANLTGPVTSSGNATAITNSAVIFSKIQNVTGPVVIGRLTSDAGVVSELTGANIASIIDASAVTNSTNAANVAIATDDTTNSSYYLYFGANITGNTALKASTKIRYNPNTGAFSATTKSFRIPHPTKPQHDLVYGSLESPYHGVRLTGKGKTKGNRAEIFLPDYVKSLIDEETVNIQLTVIKCAKILYIENIIIHDNKFTVKYDKSWYEKSKDVEFYWDFTAERKDVAKLIVEEKL
jgi:hypothetical protein